ncbi:Hypothetical protein R9X50_00400200 [Acrodontium crateriforme]|uniref:Uncharacterized protein n=1 Tax=Acrodontium crateriforme TaxID=150365 RepID=A0AAQ3M776_9PEZI|nr:Hypothetical protein R9X50_00400200 [Acrodontium crateriforme]
MASKPPLPYPEQRPYHQCRLCRQQWTDSLLSQQGSWVNNVCNYHSNSSRPGVNNEKVPNQQYNGAVGNSRSSVIPGTRNGSDNQHHQSQQQPTPRPAIPYPQQLPELASVQQQGMQTIYAPQFASNNFSLRGNRLTTLDRTQMIQAELRRFDRTMRRAQE